ncbi:hypothetical protein JTB14_016304 [Gonioctena quinquepunctata]|nr:hypothetical protein JTB14_016304 [Gonioctena quinquepunctata]
MGLQFVEHRGTGSRLARAKLQTVKQHRGPPKEPKSRNFQFNHEFARAISGNSSFMTVHYFTFGKYNRTAKSGNMEFDFLMEVKKEKDITRKMNFRTPQDGISRPQSSPRENIQGGRTDISEMSGSSSRESSTLPDQVFDAQMHEG